MKSSSGVHLLTTRQRQVAELVAKGLAHKETAAILGLSPGTVKIYLARDIYQKLGLTSRHELMRYWMEHVELPELLRAACAACGCSREMLGGPDTPVFE